MSHHSRPNYLHLFSEEERARMKERLLQHAAYLVKLENIAGDAQTLFALKRGEIPERFRAHPA